MKSDTCYSAGFKGQLTTKSHIWLKKNDRDVCFCVFFCLVAAALCTSSKVEKAPQCWGLLRMYFGIKDDETTDLFLKAILKKAKFDNKW